jgi:hypothetical protein
MSKGLHLSILIFLAAFASGCGGQTGGNAVNAVTPQATSTPLTSPVSASPIASPTISPAPDLTTKQTSGDHEIADIIRQYYEAINRHEYRRAFELWSGKGEASKQTFDDFRNGFAETAQANVLIDEKHIEIEGAAGSQYATVPVTISARMSGGHEQIYRGKYVLRRSMVDGATTEQRSWRIYSAEIEKAT